LIGISKEALFPASYKTKSIQSETDLIEPGVEIMIPPGFEYYAPTTINAARMDVKINRAGRQLLHDMCAVPFDEIAPIVGFKVTGGKIFAIDILADPARLRQLDLSVLNDCRRREQCRRIEFAL
jgi:hypothetical protein